MAETLRIRVKNLLDESKLSYVVIARESGVPYGALYHFSNKGEDMRSDYMEKLYTYLSGKPLLDNEC